MRYLAAFASLAIASSALAQAPTQQSSPGLIHSVVTSSVAHGKQSDKLRVQPLNASLVLTVDEKAALSPSVTINNPMKNIVSIFSSGGNVTSSQSSTQAFGASLSSEATRTETVGFFYPFADLIAEHKAILAAGKPTSPAERPAASWWTAI